MVAMGSDENRKQGKESEGQMMKERVFAECYRFNENAYKSAPVQLHDTIIQRLCHEGHSGAAWERGCLRRLR